MHILSKLGITNPNLHVNLSSIELIKLVEKRRIKMKMKIYTL